MPGWMKPSKVLSTQSDRSMKAPPRMYRRRNAIDDPPEPTKQSAPQSMGRAAAKRYGAGQKVIEKGVRP